MATIEYFELLIILLLADTMSKWMLLRFLEQLGGPYKVLEFILLYYIMMLAALVIIHCIAGVNLFDKVLVPRDFS